MPSTLRKAIRTGALITAGSILASVVPVYIWLQIDPVIDHASIYISCIVLPSIISPTCSWLILRTQIKAERLALENHRLANSDELTGLPNRRAFFAAARALQEEAASGQGILVCAIADIDNFKRVNDEYGHETGDTVLKSVGGALQALQPEGAILARLGGEEFAFAGVFARKEAGRQFCEALVGAVARAACGPDGVTISLGFDFGEAGDTVSDLLSRADHALYRAKDSGKNRAMGPECRVAAVRAIA